MATASVAFTEFGGFAETSFPNVSRLERYFNANADFPSVYLDRSAASPGYHSLQSQYQRRLARGVQAIASYTWSHSIAVLGKVAEELLHLLLITGGEPRCVCRARHKQMCSRREPVSCMEKHRSIPCI